MTVFPAKKGTKRHSKHLVSVSMRYLSYLSSEDFSIVSPLKQFFIMIRCSGFTRCAHSWVIELNTRREILYIYIYIHARPRIIPYSWWSLGMICDDFWNPSHAHVVFKQLAFDRAKGSLFSAAFGHGTWDMGYGTGVMWFDDVGRCGSRIRYSVVDTKDGEGATVGTGKMPVCVVIPPGERLIFKYLIWKRDTISNLFLLLPI